MAMYVNTVGEPIVVETTCEECYSAAKFTNCTVTYRNGEKTEITKFECDHCGLTYSCLNDGIHNVVPTRIEIRCDFNSPGDLSRQMYLSAGTEVHIIKNDRSHIFSTDKTAEFIIESIIEDLRRLMARISGSSKNEDDESIQDLAETTNEINKNGFSFEGQKIEDLEKDDEQETRETARKVELDLEEILKTGIFKIEIYDSTGASRVIPKGVHSFQDLNPHNLKKFNVDNANHILIKEECQIESSVSF